MVVQEEEENVLRTAGKIIGGIAVVLAILVIGGLGLKQQRGSQFDSGYQKGMVQLDQYTKKDIKRELTAYIKVTPNLRDKNIRIMKVTSEWDDKAGAYDYFVTWEQPIDGDNTKVCKDVPPRYPVEGDDDVAERLLWSLGNIQPGSSMCTTHPGGMAIDPNAPITEAEASDDN